jgi:hypothetical protein
MIVRFVLPVPGKYGMLPIIHRAMRAAVVFLAHAFLACVLVFGAWLVDLFIRLLSGSREILIYGVLPLSYLFQTVDVAMIGLFGAYGVIEAARALRSDDDNEQDPSE